MSIAIRCHDENINKLLNIKGYTSASQDSPILKKIQTKF